MDLWKLPNLRSFCSSTKNTSTIEANNSNPSQPLFCEKVAFPALGDLDVSGLDKISGIAGDKQVKHPIKEEEEESFWKLRNLPCLQRLHIFGGNNLKAIVVANKEGGAYDKPLVFPKLCSLHLYNLRNLKSFYGHCGPKEEEEEEEEEEYLQPQPLFNEKVVFPCLEELSIRSMANIEQIWISTPPTNSFNKLTSLYVCKFNRLVYVAPLELLGSLQNLQSICITECELLEEVFKTRRSNVGEGIVLRDEATSKQVEITHVLPQLERVFLKNYHV
ncbi:unnamed protein product [Camellia sinensis]